MMGPFLLTSDLIHWNQLLKFSVIKLLPFTLMIVIQLRGSEALPNQIFYKVCESGHKNCLMNNT